MRLRVGCVLARYGVDQYADALEKVDCFYAEHLPDVVRTTVVVDNALPRTKLRMLRSDTTLIGGDNSYWEFSAWDRGLAQLDRMKERVDLIHVVTSAFDTLYTGYIDKFNSSLLKEVSRAKACVGHIDHFDRPVEVLARESQHWIRTSFFFLPASAILALRSMVSFEHTEERFTADPAHPFKANAPISKQFQDYILSWLTGEGTGQGVTWHSRFTLNDETFPYFRAKALAMVNEHLLSLRLRELGFPLIDVGWLAGQIDSSRSPNVDWARPWRGQLDDRR